MSSSKALRNSAFCKVRGIGSLRTKHFSVDVDDLLGLRVPGELRSYSVLSVGDFLRQHGRVCGNRLERMAKRFHNLGAGTNIQAIGRFFGDELRRSAIVD